jgi:hypothetical protein
MHHAGQIDRGQGKGISPAILKMRVVVAIAVKIVAVRQIVAIGFVSQVNLDRVEPDYDQFRRAFVTCNGVTLLALGINKNVLAAFGANGCRHLSYSPENKKLVCVSPDIQVKIGMLINLTCKGTVWQE